MKMTILVMCVVLGLVGCEKDQAVTSPPVSKDPVSLGAITLEAVYDAERHYAGPETAEETVVKPLQRVLAMWPDTGPATGLDACRMAAKVYLVHMHNQQSNLNVSLDGRSSDYRAECRVAIGSS